ncbi:MAG: hypothetical protein K2G26_04155, partial [Clostridia bacterium]|nr:hypothetical protein [Clostridia bacterium]
LTPIFCVALCVGTVFSFSDNGKVYGADVPVKQSGAYLDLDNGSKIINGFEGKQQEYIYFGSNVNSSRQHTPGYKNKHTGAIKWRVLDTGDNNKYGNGMLLWADYQIGSGFYNTYYQNPEYAFWGTSMLRAKLNGGKYYNAVGNVSAIPKAATTVNENDSWYAKLFDDDEKSLVVQTGSYTTDSWGTDTRAAQYQYLKEGILTSGDVNGHYNIDRLDHTSSPASQYAYYDETKGTVWEETQSDKLFLLDYYDINNPDYGFSDDGLVYAAKVAEYAHSVDPNDYSATWSNSSDRYLGLFDGAKKGNNDIHSDYLRYSSDSEVFYWLRPAGRYMPSISYALGVGEDGSVDVGQVNYDYGVRPAFNFDPTQLAYITASVPDTNWVNMSAIASVDNYKPAYKAYLKDNGYSTHSSNAKATIGASNGTLYIKYNNPLEDIRDGKLLILLQDKGAADGSIAWQTSISMSDEATVNKSVFTTVSLPSDVSFADYNLLMLYTTDNGEYSTEKIYCSYVTNSGIDAPGTISAVDYDGSSKWISELQGEQKPDWLNTDIYNNAAFMTVESISYSDHLGSAATNLTLPVNKEDIINAGVYTVTLKLANGLKWSDSSTGTKSFTITINQISPHANPQYEKVMKRFLRDGLPKLTNIEGGVAGEFSWGIQQPQLGTNDYTWTFIPEDKVNYVSTDSGKIQLSFVQAEIKEIKINEDAEIFDNLTLEEIKERLGITAVYEDGSEAPLSGDAFDLITQDDPLPPGDGYTITVELPDGRFWDFTVNVTKAEMTSIRTNWINGSTFTYPVTSEEILKALRITTTWNYAGNTAIELTNEEKVEYLTLDGEITIGKPSLTVTYQEGAKKLTATITPTINKGTLDISGITFTGDTVTYSGDYTKLTATGNVVCAKSGEVISGVNFVYTYLKDSAEVDGAADNGVANAGTYTVKLSFTHSNGYYEPIEEIKTTTLTINKAKVTGIVFAGDSKPEITGKTYTLEATGVPSWVSVVYSVEGQEGTSFGAAGTYKFTATFTH